MKLIVISGLSGAGKSIALSVLEDLGYYCVDNLPLGLLAAARRGIEVVSVSATAVKKSLTGNGHAGKSQVQRAIVATLGLSQCPEPPDVADALAVALCAAIGRDGSRRQTGVMT